MKRNLWLIPLAIMAVSCSIKEDNAPEMVKGEKVYARIESTDTKVYADENLKVLWNADDRISLFNKYTYNKQYKFTGNTGDNAGEFEEVTSSVVTGNSLDNVYAVYPYVESTSISNSGVLTVNFPSEQTYREDSFGQGANVMVSATTNTDLLFKNLGGYLILKLYGEGVSVSSITLAGNNDEVLAGPATITAEVGSLPEMTFTESGTSKSITLKCETPVTLGATAEDATTFWIVVPPVEFSKGFNIVVSDPNGNTFEKSTSSSAEVKRNSTFRMSALEVKVESDPDYSKKHLTFKVLSDGTIGWKAQSTSTEVKTIEYSINGDNWAELTSSLSGVSIAVSSGDIVRFKGNNAQYAASPTSYNHFTSTCQFEVYGNIMSLISGDNFESSSLSSDYTFLRLFCQCSGLISAENLILGETTLTGYCYYNMFLSCSSLVSAPALPATDLADYCYYGMFNTCSSLLTAPELPATKLSDHCYAGMFSGCEALETAPKLPAIILTPYCYQTMFAGTSLTMAPELPALSLADHCYDGMFQKCTHLKIAPELPATTLKGYSYSNMFNGCTSLTSSPDLGATKLDVWCCQSMFYGCTSLTSAPALPATELADYCYANMFTGCSSLTTAPVLPAKTLVSCCYQTMFASCTNLSYIKCLATDISATDCLFNWVYNVKSSGTFVKSSSMTSWPTGSKGIPSGWTVRNG